MQADRKLVKAIEYARRVVLEAETAAARVAPLPDGVNKRLETITATSSIGEARGVLAVLEILAPGNTTIESLRRQLNHCPVIMLVGPERAQASRPPIPSVM